MNGFKKFLYFINDVSNVALEKDKEKLRRANYRLKVSLIFIAVLLIITLLLNLFGIL
ncbi:MAG: hypothetical protein V1865_01295 [bacterium]